MPHSLEPHRQQLRTRIARSRRRLDRHARQLLSNGHSIVPLARLGTSGRSWSQFIVLAIGLALSRWAFDRKLFTNWRQQLLGQSVSTWLDQLLRRVRVAAWQSRRSARANTDETSSTEVTDE